MSELQTPAPQTSRNDKQIAYWLCFCAFTIYCMILLGGVTRLTESGLSMVEWKPLIGAIPPLNDAQWQESFSQYQQFPEYQKVNHGMSLDKYKTIFYFEYSHRLLGRLIGVFFLLPFLYFWLRGRIKKGLTPKLAVMFVLGGLQGVLGWYMVMSGLVDNPRVSHYRLAAHLGAAVVIYVYILWVAMDLLQPRNVAGALAKHSAALCWLLFAMILTGALVAGTRAGLVYPTWPLMGDSFIPPNLYSSSPFWLAAFEDLTTIQFNHRIFAYFLAIAISALSIGLLRSYPTRQMRVAVVALMLVLLLQISLGISTLLLHVPVAVAASHQGVAMLLLTIALFVAHSTRLAQAR